MDDRKVQLKIRKQLLDHEKISYAMDHIELPDGGIDCSEGCNPYGFPPECRNALKNFDPARLGPYPHSTAFHDAVIEYWKDHACLERGNIILTDGSMSALYIVNYIFDTHNAAVLGVSPQFTDYYMHAGMIGIEYAPYQLDRNMNYRFDTDGFLALLHREDGSSLRQYNFIYLDNPNNPTGQCIDIADIERIVTEAAEHDITVIIDEAYGDFMSKENSAVQLVQKYLNLVVVRTMSKGFGLAGMRAGYIIAQKEMIAYMNKMVNPYMVGELTREISAEAMLHREFIEKSMEDFGVMKSRLREALGCTGDRPEGGIGKLHMAETSDTTSLVLLYHDDPEIDLKKEFWEKGVLVIDGNDFKGLDSSSVRVRLPIISEFPVLLAAVEEISRV